jgi:hypothetical protein
MVISGLPSTTKLSSDLTIVYRASSKSGGPVIEINFSAQGRRQYEKIHFIDPNKPQ